MNQFPALSVLWIYVDYRGSVLLFISGYEIEKQSTCEVFILDYVYHSLFDKCFPEIYFPILFT